ncbi:unnamed protein product [Adineta steineri]|uniref:Uncharacterized protein n=1 Tax=Adineta steineri TaxID=433720 RepID=A0A814A615_9BILA|nr:unnamed protein product [Adineta steineri]CAF0778748.1 unnamed protein product [Adineta steineri]CAF0907825.1 unnamed protein product [Adineta steineri]CAF1236100.1 unnamed protein product [Adineta steineri]CAF1579709.1 unnamed protein product [Adineta steineri]
MSKFNLISFVICVYFIVLQLTIIECRPRTQKIVVHGHEWTVPNEPGWKEILDEAEPIRRKYLTDCASSRECRLAAERLRDIFLKYPVSAKYYDDFLDSDYRSSDIDSIFKWG